MSVQKHESKSSAWRLRIGERRVMMLLGDLLASIISLALGTYLWAIAETSPLPLPEFLSLRLEWWFFSLPILWIFLLVDSYDPRRSTDWRKTRRSVVTAAAIGFLLYITFYFTAPPSTLPRRGIAIFLFFAATLTLIWRFIYIRVFTTPQFMHRVLLVGAGKSGRELLKVINGLWPPPYYVVGIIDDDPDKQGKKIEDFNVLGGCDRLLDIIAQEYITDVIVSITGQINPTMFDALVSAQTHGITITRMPVAYEELLQRVPVNYLEADWMLRSFVDEARISAFYRFFKRVIDIIGGAVGVIILGLISPFVSLIILLDDGWPIVFKQTRAGRGGVPYTIYKFRTMRNDAEKEGAQLAQEDDHRATRTGKLLRKTHLDEFPQFINVMRGDMSIVGPRPERPEYIEHFQRRIPFFSARLLTKPGIAGWAQIHQNYAADLDEMVEKLEYDLYYIKHRSIWLDIVIILRTFATIVGFRGR